MRLVALVETGTDEEGETAMTGPRLPTRAIPTNSSEDPAMAEHQGEPNIYLTLRRVIDAPVQRVYEGWTDPELLRQWLAPGNAVASRAVADVAVGGAFLIEMRGTNGQRWLAPGVYREVAPLRRLVTHLALGRQRHRDAGHHRVRT